MGLSHLDERGKARMVDISEKPPTKREAVARASVHMKPATIRLIRDKAIPKGDVMAAARIAGIMAAKKTCELVPMCHPLNITSVSVDLAIDAKISTIAIEAKVKTVGQTGVEMEALTAVSVAALTVYDMCKAVDREMTISYIMLIEKRGGRSGEFRRTVSSPFSRKTAATKRSKQ
jgi:cyclic pyranopterin phosphate synthase